MSFNPLKEKGMQLEDQIRTWHEIAGKPLNKTMTNCYTRARQLLLNSIETGARNFKHMFSQFCKDTEAKKLIADIRRIEDMQQTTVNWLTPSDQSVLETTLAYEQTAVDLTAGIAQNEPDSYVKQAFDFCLLEDFDHLYRYSQWAYIIHNVKPSDITQCQTDIVVGRPTQQQHNVNSMRIRKPYDRKKAAIQTKVNIRTILALEHQTQNFYSEHGMYYGNGVLRETYAEICDVEEEHVTMYGSLIDSKESLYEKLLLQEFTEVCAYYSCMEDEKDESVRKIWERFLLFELEHLQAAAKLFEKHEKRDAQEVIGDKVIVTASICSQKDYTRALLKEQLGKRLDTKKGYTNINNLPPKWDSYYIQDHVALEGAPTETVIRIMGPSYGRDIVEGSERLIYKEPDLVSMGLQQLAQAANTVGVEDYCEMQSRCPRYDLF